MTDPIMQSLLVFNHILLEQLSMHLLALGFESLPDFICELLNKLGSIHVVLVDSCEGVIVMNVVRSVFHADVLKQHQ